MTRIAVIIPSLGRREVLTRMVAGLGRQTRPADVVCLCVTDPKDAPELLPPLCELHLSQPGLCIQRNVAMRALAGRADVIVWFDDDFVPAPDYLHALERFFTEHQDAAGVTGEVLADGVTGPGLTFEEAERIIENADKHMLARKKAARAESLYGCNMSFRAGAIEGLEFDTRLPLYGWLEDVDFSMQAGRRGRLYKSASLIGVHLGVKAGRNSGVRFGYSQIANPAYLLGKGTISVPHAASTMMRNLINNHLRFLAPEPFVDRRGRVAGNWKAIADLLRGRLKPERILQL